MKRKVFLATNNHGKIERFKNLLKQVAPELEILTCEDLGIEPVDVIENGKTLKENAILKAEAYLGKVDMPILSNDTGFYVEGDGFVEAPKRMALGDSDENQMTKDQIAEKLLEFWKGVATKHGGKVDAAWFESFVLVEPDGRIHASNSRREVTLTNQEFGKPHIQMPIRSLYLSKTSNKPAVQHTEEEEILEMQPVINALKEVLQTVRDCARLSLAQLNTNYFSW